MMIVCLNNINVYKIFGIFVNKIIHSPTLGLVWCPEIRGITFINCHMAAILEFNQPRLSGDIKQIRGLAYEDVWSHDLKIIYF